MIDVNETLNNDLLNNKNFDFINWYLDDEHGIY